MEKIETRTAVITLFKPLIVWESFKRGVKIDVEDIHENIAASLKLTEGKRHAAVLDTRDKEVSITQKALRYGASVEVTKYRIATAHLTTSMAGVVFGNYFMKFFNPKINNRMFSDDKEAVKWLCEFAEILQRPGI